MTDAKAVKSKQPGQRMLDDPAVPPKLPAGAYAPSCDARGDAAGARGTPRDRGVIGIVGVELGLVETAVVRVSTGGW